MSIASALERVPPQNLEAEQAVLGSMLLERDAIATVVELIQPTDFYREAHRVIYQAIADLFERGEPVDLISLTDLLRNRGQLDGVGGAAYVGLLLNSVPTAANVEYYARIVMQKAMLRGLISAGTQIAQLGFQGNDDVEILIDRAEKMVFAIAQRRLTQEFVPIRSVLLETFEKLDQRGKGAVTGLATGFTDLDLLTAGFQPSDVVIVAGRPSMGKCLEKSAQIVLQDGRVATIEEVYREQQARLPTLGDDWKFHFTSPSDYVDDGIKPVFRLTTRLGRSVECTATHPFLTMRGWRPLSELVPGVRIAVPRRVSIFGTQAMRQCEVRVLAYLIGDGGLSTGSITFTSANPRIVDDFEAAVEEFGGVRVRQDRNCLGLRPASFSVGRSTQLIAHQRTEFAQRLQMVLGGSRGAAARLARSLNVHSGAVTRWRRGRSVPSEVAFDRLCSHLGVDRNALAPRGWSTIRRSSKNAMALWLSELGLLGKAAHSKFIPAAVFTLPREQLALFLNRLFATDGWASVQTTVDVAQIGYSSVSERLIREVQHLLLRFGIISRIRPRMARYNGTRRPSWQLEVTERSSIERFAQEIGIFGKEAAVQAVLQAVSARRRKAFRDTVPVDVWDSLDAARGEEAWRALAERAGVAGTSNMHVGRRGLSRERLALLAKALDSEPLRRLAASDVYWDEIVAIEPVGAKQVYDLTIPETHNFVANDICVHNTTFGLNVAAHAAITHKVPVAVFSLETSKEQLAQRLLCAEAGVDNSRLRTGFLSDEDWRRISRAVGTLSEAKIFIDDSANITVIEMRAKARKLMAEHGLGLLIIDYIQLIQSYRRPENRNQEISEIARSLKSLAKELSIPVLITSQLSRAVEMTGTRRPMLSHLRESGELEQVADLVVFLYRDDYYDPATERKNVAEVIVAKHRNGPTGTIELFFHREHSKFANLERKRA